MRMNVYNVLLVSEEVIVCYKIVNVFLGIMIITILRKTVKNVNILVYNVISINTSVLNV